MADFCTVAQVAEFLQIEITAADKVASCERAIAGATAAIRTYCRQHLELVTDESLTLDVWAPIYNLILPEMPVVSVASVTEDDELLTEGSDEDYVLAQHGLLIRRGARWLVGPQIVEIIYTHGHATLPVIITDVCTRAASRAYQAGLRAAGEEGVPGIAGKSLGDFSVTYSSGAGGIGAGVSGASGSRLLLLSEKDFLNPYRF